MKIAFLVRGEDVKNQFSGHELPDGVKRTVGIYKAEGGDLFFVSNGKKPTGYACGAVAVLHGS